MSVLTWGKADNVRKTLALHNDATRRVAARHPETILIDLARLMPHNGACFADPCHLTEEGRRRFAEIVLANEASAAGRADR